MTWKKLYRNAFAPWIIVFGGAFLMAYVFRGPGGRYIVIKKEENKILYYPVNNPNFLYVMTFDNDTSSAGFYNYINVGDTITGAARRLCNRESTSPVTDYAIETVNGKTLPELREIARRDSMLHDMAIHHR
ncbi:MAG: hypothetical protein K2M34_04245 [Alphaproteobacteria bacterium]|nr:hypothetical protein [Alphaproteobacteria bacterium]